MRLCALCSPFPLYSFSIQNCWTSDVRYHICALKKNLFVDLMSMTFFFVCSFCVILLMAVCFRGLGSICKYVPSTDLTYCSSEHQKYLPLLDSCGCLCHPCVTLFCHENPLLWDSFNIKICLASQEQNIMFL